jgi:phosphopantothenoylcysteine decarboxylase/phosphopantothenate--cysteine ligase
MPQGPDGSEPEGGTPPLSAAPPIGHGRLSGRRITLGVTGSIAAFKAVLVLRELALDGAHVEVVLTEAGEHFVGQATFSGLTGRPVHTRMFHPHLGGETHIKLAKESDLVLVAPATADTIARLAAGRADDLLGAVALASRCPLLVAPAMHPRMWEHPATRRNIELLAELGRVSFVGPVEGWVASGDYGVGRMAEPEDVLAATRAVLSGSALEGRHVVVTAGPTVEDIDPVRFISNRSSGKMGFAVAERAAARGARVTLIAGPVSIRTPWNVTRIDTRSAEGMRAALHQALGNDLDKADALVMAAAVGDYRPAELHAEKLKREPGRSIELALVPNADLLAEVGQARKGRSPVLVGFALETGKTDAVIRCAQQKLAGKHVDLVVANRADDALGRDMNRAILVTESGSEPLDELPKHEVADRILDFVESRLEPQLP